MKKFRYVLEVEIDEAARKGRLGPSSVTESGIKRSIDHMVDKLEGVRRVSSDCIEQRPKVRGQA